MLDYILLKEEIRTAIMLYAPITAATLSFLLLSASLVINQIQIEITRTLEDKNSMSKML
jgi:hypothetical protein